MLRILKLALILHITSFYNIRVLAANSTAVDSTAAVNLTTIANPVVAAFEAHGVVPEAFDKSPPALASVKFPSGVYADLGNELTPTQVKDEPTVSWDAVSDQFYTLVMSDLDGTSRVNPENHGVQHWLVGNIPGSNLSGGETLSQYVSSGPTLGTGLHRYVFIVYKQPSNMTFNEPRLNNTSTYGRLQFSISQLATKYNLGDPIAGNFYKAQYDDYVPIVHEQLGISTSNRSARNDTVDNTTASNTPASNATMSNTNEGDTTASNTTAGDTTASNTTPSNATEGNAPSNTKKAVDTPKRVSSGCEPVRFGMSILFIVGFIFLT